MLINLPTQRNIGALAYRYALCGMLILSLVACSESNPQKAALNQAVHLMARIVTSKTLIDAVQNADPQMRASTAAGAALSGGVTAEFPEPPAGIAILTTLQPTQTWSVTIKGDDQKKQVILQGYGEDLQTPLVTQTIDFPPP